MKNSFFITGNDTNIGKTFLSNLICKYCHLNYWKPIQTGILEDCDTDFLIQNGVKTFPESYKFKLPLAPSVASRSENVEIDINKILSDYKNIKSDKLIVEGAGGVFVPILLNFYIIDLIKLLNLPVILVVENRLGCINQAIMSYFCLQKYNISIKCIILNKGQNDDHVREIFSFTKLPIFQIPNINTQFDQKEISNIMQEIKYFLFNNDL